MMINGERLWGRLMDMAKVGATENGGNNRQALTDLDIEGRRLFIRWCEEAGCEVRLDEIGNIFATRVGRMKDAPVVMAGSHLDTQPTGGRFDGVYGVLGALEVVETLNDKGVETEHPIEIAVWCNEEGCRFPSSMMGSAVWSGALDKADAMALRDADDISVGDELQRTGHFGSIPAAPFPIKAAFELHIEQGPVLEASGEPIGIVTGVQNMSRQEFVVTGQEGHAGPTPMALRKDPMRAVATFLPRLYDMCAARGEDARITFGEVSALPGSGNTIPGRVVITSDLRHPDRGVYLGMVEEARAIVRDACKATKTSVEIAELFHAPGVEFDANCVSAVERAVSGLGYPARRIVSGAGHDACNVARVAPTAMIFIPCRDGISHNESEFAEPRHVTAGANVLLATLVDCAGAVS